MRASTASWLLLLLLAAGCQSTAGDRLQACGLYTDGEFGELPLYLPNACYEQCYGAATCAEIEATLCSDAITLPLRCDQECAFRCPDGSILPVEAQCNGSDECESGADELNCPPTPRPGRPDCTSNPEDPRCPFVCADGQRLFYDGRCDGRETCVDGSDEAGCAERLACETM